MGVIYNDFQKHCYMNIGVFLSFVGLKQRWMLNGIRPKENPLRRQGAGKLNSVKRKMKKHSDNICRSVFFRFWTIF